MSATILALFVFKPRKRTILRFHICSSWLTRNKCEKKIFIDLDIVQNLLTLTDILSKFLNPEPWNFGFNWWTKWFVCFAWMFFKMVINWLQFSCMSLNFLIAIKGLSTIHLRVCTLLSVCIMSMKNYFLCFSLDFDWRHCKFVFIKTACHIVQCPCAKTSIDHWWSNWWCIILMNKLLTM